MNVQVFRANYRRFVYNSPEATMRVFQLALDNTWLGIVADVP